MSYFSAGWITEARKKFGEAPYVALDVLPVGASASVTVLTELEDVLALNPIVTERERKFGSVQGQSWQIQLTNMTLTARSSSIPGGWARIRVGFPTADEWETLATGRVLSAPASTDGTITLEVEDQIVALIQAELDQDMRFQLSTVASPYGWISEVKPVIRADGSKSYNNAAAGAGTSITVNPGYVEDATFYIEFTSATAFKIVEPDGTDTQTGTISADCTFSLNAQASAKIEKEGWDTGTGAYASGDKFVVYTARGRKNDGTLDPDDIELGFIGLVRHLIEDVAGYQVYDFDTDSYISPTYDSDNWDALADATEGDNCQGTFTKGTRIIDMIEGILPLAHASLYIMPNGQIAVWMLQPAVGDAYLLNGDHDGRDVSILSGLASPHLGETYNRVVYRYKSLTDGSEAVVEKSDPDTPYDRDMLLEIETDWEVRALSVETAATRAIERFKGPAEPFTLVTTFDGATLEIGDLVAINDSALGVVNRQAAVVKIARDPMAGRATVDAIVEEITLGEYFKIGLNRIGGSGDTDAGMIW